MQVGMYQFIEFHTSGANSAGILFTTVFTADVTGISYCQRQLSCTFGTANQLCMRDSSFFTSAMSRCFASSCPITSLNNIAFIVIYLLFNKLLLQLPLHCSRHLRYRNECWEPHRLLIHGTGVCTILCQDFPLLHLFDISSLRLPVLAASLS